MVKVIFYETVTTGQVVGAEISYNGKKYTCKGNRNYLDALPPETESPETIIAAMRGAPAKYDGSYLRAEFIDSVKGGEGSGLHDHAGLVGQSGGSPQSGASSDSTASDSTAAAKGIRSAAETVEPEITKLVATVAKEHGGKMYGLEHRLKEVPSLKRRLDWTMEHDGCDLDGAIEDIVDSVRYTIVLDDDVYVDRSSATLKALEDQGWKEYDELSENYWGSDMGFKGLCYVLVKGGVRFELQFHTPRGAAVLEESHILYEKIRARSTGKRTGRVGAQGAGSSACCSVSTGGEDGSMKPYSGDVTRYFGSFCYHPNSPDYKKLRTVFRWIQDDKVLFMDRWNGEEWVDCPGLYRVTGAGGATGMREITKEQAEGFVRKQGR